MLSSGWWVLLVLVFSDMAIRAAAVAGEVEVDRGFLRGDS